MKQMNKFLMTVLCLLLFVFVFAFPAQAVKVEQLDLNSASWFGANRMVTFKYMDLTNTTTNVAQTVSNVLNIAAASSVELKAMRLVTPFASGNTNYVGSLLVTVGDSAGVNTFLTSNQLHAESNYTTLAMGYPASTTFTAVVASVTNSYTVPVVNTQVGLKTYSSGDYLRFVFTPSAYEAVGTNTAGEVRFYFRIIKAGDLP